MRKNNILRLLLTVVWIMMAARSRGQDSVNTLSAGQVMQLVKMYHPVAKQASLLIEKAKADITIARGGFDPVLYNSNAQKTFDGTDYYQYNRPELTLPTWFGITVHAGLEKLSGSRTNPEETTGETSYLGVSIPLARNLLMDKRRAALQTAKIFREASEVERRNILNNLLLEVMKSYWYWVQYHQVYKILNDAVLVNEKRVELVKTGFRIGERPAIDTTEALTQLQNFQVLRENAWMQFQNAGLDISAFLWTAEGAPYLLPENVIPAPEDLISNISTSALPVVNELLEAAVKNHPELLLYEYKLDVLSVEKKLKFQELLPVVDFRYNQLGKGYDILKTATGPLFENNYQYGITLGLPLRLSEGRGGFRKTKIKITETKLDQRLKKVQVENKIKSYFNELSALQKQFILQEQAYRNYLSLQRAEETRFRIGESSLFLVNARENKALEALQKLKELQTKYLVTVNALQWAAGLLVP